MKKALTAAAAGTMLRNGHIQNSMMAGSIANGFQGKSEIFSQTTLQDPMARRSSYIQDDGIPHLRRHRITEEELTIISKGGTLSSAASAGANLGARAGQAVMSDDALVSEVASAPAGIGQAAADKITDSSSDTQKSVDGKKEDCSKGFGVFLKGENISKAWINDDLTERLKLFKNTPFHKKALLLLSKEQKAQAQLEKMDCESVPFDDDSWNEVSGSGKSKSGKKKSKRDKLWEEISNLRADFFSLQSECLAWHADRVEGSVKKSAGILLKGKLVIEDAEIEDATIKHKPDDEDDEVKKGFGLIADNFGASDYNDPVNSVRFYCGSPFYSKAMELEADLIKLEAESCLIPFVPYKERNSEKGKENERKMKEVHEKMNVVRSKKKELSAEYLRWKASELRKEDSMQKSFGFHVSVSS